MARSGTTNLAAALSNGILEQKVVQEPFSKISGDVERFKWLRELQSEFGFLDENILAGSDCVFPLGQQGVDSFVEKLYKKNVGIKHVFSGAPNITVNVPLINYALVNDIKIIYLRRKRIFDAALSSELALQHGFWGWRDDAREVLDDFEYKPLNRDSVLETAEYMYASSSVVESEIEEKIPESNRLHFYYEDLYDEDWYCRDENFDKICDFIELKRSDLLEDVIQWQFLNDNKQNKLSNLTRISNYEDILELTKLYPYIA
jgi:hypothetical protein